MCGAKFTLYSVINTSFELSYLLDTSPFRLSMTCTLRNISHFEHDFKGEKSILYILKQGII